MPETMKTLLDQTRALLLWAALAVSACSTTPPPAPEVTTAPFDSALSAVVGVYANIPEDARTADSLGVQRQGSGVLIDNDGLVLTIGYLILEADEIAVVGPEGNQIEADPVAYDHTTGFGLIRAREPVGATALKIGSSKNLGDGTPVLAVSFGGPDAIVAAQVVSRRSFAGYWEYLLEKAIFTIPPHHEFGGAALIDRKGELVGIGSLMVNDAVVGDHPVIGNMFVPIDSLKPILADLLTSGRRKPPVPPWLGLNTDEARGRVYITRLSEGGPAEQAGLKQGDIIIGVGGKRIGTMIEFFRKVRIQGNAGSPVQLDVLPVASTDLTIKKINVKSIDRYDWLSNP
ncbi:MAG: serine protease [Rhodospirillaceae bacterium]|nr:serine protease [Rhodospirillaceae bacterium]MBT5242649.1 serine protease [Rhodospirillaceae bacterium]MBT5562812.1 serine protease [Rhodospirillaceae bacterium]MBT6241241.1 serine protease [Rhodospirillaceae bacterium]MBT7138048.1 serine protease [Rhodospirillaceae bacterium]